MVEALRRHREQLIRQQRSATILTWAMAVLALVQVILAVVALQRVP